MDTTQTITHVGLCAGYGGIELGLKRVLPTLRTVALSEIEAFACSNLVAKMEAGLMDSAPIWTNLKSFPWGAFRDRVDILTGGYPCQPFSAAGKRLGADDPRHLWPFISAGIAAMRPKLCFFENVEGHISLGLPDVIEDLAGMGYRATWGIFSAAECLDANGRTAPHQRKRVFILAHRNGSGLEGHFSKFTHQIEWQEPVRSIAGRSGSSGEGAVANSNDRGSWEDWQSSQPRAISVEQSSGIKGHGDAKQVREMQIWPSRPGEPQHAWEPPRVVGNGDSFDGGSPSEKRQHDAEAGQAGGGVGDTALLNDTGQTGGQRKEASWGTCPTWNDGQTQPALGGDANGPANRMDDAELYTACDNRTDELRLLGNGVVPATAALAFSILFNELMTNETKLHRDKQPLTV